VSIVVVMVILMVTMALTGQSDKELEESGFMEATEGVVFCNDQYFYHLG